MEYFITAENIDKYIILPKTFDWDLVDQERGFKKLFSIVPKSVYLQIVASFEDSDKEIARLLTKAAIHYSFVLSIPKIKVHINSTGINQFEQDKLKTAPWWDVRDLGLSLLKFADELMSEAITLLSESTWKTEIPFFQNVSEEIKTPADFEAIFSINNSPEVFLMLQRYLKQALLLKIGKVINGDCLALIKENEVLNNFLKDALAFYALYYASQLPAFVFLQNAVVIQYEELPWQKSQVLDSKVKYQSGQNFLKLADESLKLITDYIKEHNTEFPCYQPPKSEHIMVAKPSGLYLL